MAELELAIEKFSEIDGIGAEELKDMLIPKLGTTLSRETKGYNVYVDLMQHKLNKLGYKDMEGKELKEDGVFGTNTEFAVNTFKETNKLWNHNEYRGKVGQTSYDMLYSGKARRSPGYDDQGTGNGTGMSEEEFRAEMEKLVKSNLNLVEYYKGFNSTNDALDVVFKYDERIAEVSKQLGIPKELIQTVLFKEIRMYDIKDVVGDLAVIEYHTGVNTTQLYMPNNIPIQFNDIKKVRDSSTGLGQIFAKTAILAEQSINNSSLNYKNDKDILTIWNKLQNDSENIYYAGLVLKAEAKGLGVDLGNASSSDLQKVLARYNGTDYRAKEYGAETIQYYDLFKKYSSVR